MATSVPLTPEFLNRKFSEAEGRITKRIDGIVQRANAHHKDILARFTTLETRLDSANRELGSISARLSSIESKLDKLLDR